MLSTAVLCVFYAFAPAPLPQGARSTFRPDCVWDTPDARVQPDTAALERCVWIDPRNADALAALAGEYERAGVYQKAEETYRRAVAADANFADCRLRLASLLLRSGKPAEARQEAAEVLRLQPNRQAALDLLGAASGAPARGGQ